MPLHDTSTIDAIGEDETSGALVLTLLDELDWTDPPQHWEQLTLKLNSYLNFLVSGQAQEHYPHADAASFQIGIVFRFEPPLEIVDALTRSAEFVSNLGFGLQWWTHAI